MPDEKPQSKPRQRHRFTIMEGIVRDFISLEPNDRDWVRNEIAAKEAEARKGQAGSPGPGPCPAGPPGPSTGPSAN